MRTREDLTMVKHLKCHIKTIACTSKLVFTDTDYRAYVEIDYVL